MVLLPRAVIILYFQESPKPDVKVSLDVGERQSHQDGSLESEAYKEKQDTDILAEEIAAITNNNMWICPKVSGRRPTPRYQVLKESVFFTM
mgnify:CR=1 FL=1